MSGKTRKLIWSAPLVAVFAFAGALAIFVALAPGAARADHADLPGPVTGLKAEAKSRTSIQLSWMPAAASDTVGAPTSYRIDQSSDNRTWERLEENAAGTPMAGGRVAHMITEDVSSATKLHYRVFAKNAAGTGPISNQPVTVYVHVGAVFLPEAPETFTLTVRAVSNNQIDLSWTEPAIRGAKVTGYIVTEMVGGDGNSARTACSAAADCLLIEMADQGTERTAEHKMLTAGTTHYYQVTAVTESDVGNTLSNVVGSVTPAAVAPGAPQHPVASPNEGNGVFLYWIKPASTGGHGLDDPEVQYKADYDAETEDDVTAWTAIDNQSTERIEFIRAPATPHDAAVTSASAGEYRFRIRSKQLGDAADGLGLTSGWVNFNGGRAVKLPEDNNDDTGVPLQPALTATEKYATSEAEVGIRLTWKKGNNNSLTDLTDDGPNPDDYRIDVSDDGLEWERGQINTININHWDDFNAKASTPRFYRLIAKNSNHYSEADGITATADPASDCQTRHRAEPEGHRHFRHGNPAGLGRRHGSRPVRPLCSGRWRKQCAR